MNSPPHEGRSQDRGSGHLSLGRVNGSLRGAMDMDPGDLVVLHGGTGAIDMRSPS